MDKDVVSTLFVFDFGFFKKCENFFLLSSFLLFLFAVTFVVWLRAFFVRVFVFSVKCCLKTRGCCAWFNFICRTQHLMNRQFARPHWLFKQNWVRFFFSLAPLQAQDTIALLHSFSLFVSKRISSSIGLGIFFCTFLFLFFLYFFSHENLLLLYTKLRCFIL